MNKFGIFGIILLVAGSCGCSREELYIEPDEEQIVVVDYEDWSDATHSKDAELNYATVFNQTKVNRIDIEMSSKNWAAMQSDLATILGQGGGPRPGGGLSSTDDPMWVEATVKFNDIQWYHVGVRYKGNSSLQSAYRSGNNKLSFKLDFDEFEDSYPAIKNQRFYGFKQLNLNNNFDDASLMREKVGADLFREFGLTAAQTSFYVLYINNGAETQYYGVYALVEEVDDTVIETQFTKKSGNLYKPDGDAASFAQGTYNTDEMELKTNEDSANYSDVLALYDVINSEERTSNTEVWKTNVENVFDVAVFMKWLAANTVMQNWDTYGNMTHNYLLYNNPDNGLLTWIPWDNNEAFQNGKQGGALSLELSEVSTTWPLIRYLADVPEYKQMYENYLKEFITNVFVPSKLIETYTTNYELLKSYAYLEEPNYTFIRNSSDFDNAIETLKTHVQSRNSAVNAYLK